MVDSENDRDIVVVGGGQAALALGFYLRRSDLTYAILDEQESGGGSWRRGWESLRAFSPAEWSSLPGWLMPRALVDGSQYPSRKAVVEYLSNYESRYQLPIRRGIHVDAVEKMANDSRLLIRTNSESWYARAVVSATGGKPVLPKVEGQKGFGGKQLHSIEYSTPEAFRGKSVVVVGAGNSAAQIVAELTEPDREVRRVTWATLETPTFLPDEIDGRYVFDQATVRYKAQKEGRDPGPTRSLGDIVMVAPVKAARDRGTLVSVRMFERLTAAGVVWSDGRETAEDVIIWATGYRPALDHLRNLGIIDPKGRAAVGGAAGMRSLEVPNLWLVGYGNWTGYASATLIGVGRSARATVQEVRSVLLSQENSPQN